MENVIKLQKMLENLGDNELVKEMQAPSGVAPQYLVMTELKRRKDLRDSYKMDMSSKNIPKTTVADEYINHAQQGLNRQSGIMGLNGRSTSPNPADYSGGQMTAARGYANGGIVQAFKDGNAVRSQKTTRSRDPKDFEILLASLMPDYEERYRENPNKATKELLKKLNDAGYSANDIAKNGVPVASPEEAKDKIPPLPRMTPKVSIQDMGMGTDLISPEAMMGRMGDMTSPVRSPVMPDDAQYIPPVGDNIGQVSPPSMSMTPYDRNMLGAQPTRSPTSMEARVTQGGVPFNWSDEQKKWFAGLGRRAAEATGPRGGWSAGWERLKNPVWDRDTDFAAIPAASAQQPTGSPTAVRAPVTVNGIPVGGGAIPEYMSEPAPSGTINNSGASYMMDLPQSQAQVVNDPEMDALFADAAPGDGQISWEGQPAATGQQQVAAVAAANSHLSRIDALEKRIEDRLGRLDQNSDMSQFREGIPDKSYMKNMALLQAGAAMMSGRSPFAAENIGAGITAGLGTYGTLRGQAQEQKALAARMGMENDRAAIGGLGDLLQTRASMQNAELSRENSKATLLQVADRIQAANPGMDANEALAQAATTVSAAQFGSISQREVASLQAALNKDMEYQVAVMQKDEEGQRRAIERIVRAQELLGGTPAAPGATPSSDTAAKPRITHRTSIKDN